IDPFPPSSSSSSQLLPDGTLLGFEIASRRSPATRLSSRRQATLPVVWLQGRDSEPESASTKPLGTIGSGSRLPKAR
ncbi:MAG: hypothetical protein ACKN9U_13635, partial [Pirellulaceae bacterium]